MKAYASYSIHLQYLPYVIDTVDIFISERYWDGASSSTPPPPTPLLHLSSTSTEADSIPRSAPRSPTPQVDLIRANESLEPSLSSLPLLRFSQHSLVLHKPTEPGQIITTRSQLFLLQHSDATHFAPEKSEPPWSLRNAIRSTTTQLYPKYLLIQEQSRNRFLLSRRTPVSADPDNKLSHSNRFNRSKGPTNPPATARRTPSKFVRIRMVHPQSSLVD
jgi:hypothetical protein